MTAFTTVYGLPYEGINELPGGTITGGPDGNTPILAVEVERVLRDQHLAPAVENNEFANESNISSTSYITGGTVCSVTFTAPSSGKVKAFIYGALRGPGTDHVIMSFEVREDSSGGALVHGPNDNDGMSRQDTDLERFSSFRLVSGLTPGAFYFAQTMHRVTGGSSADIIHRRLMVDPAS